jgi:hypothetical protein
MSRFDVPVPLAVKVWLAVMRVPSRRDSQAKR